jgi:hypothetical protein
MSIRKKSIFGENGRSKTIERWGRVVSAGVVITKAK